jgi:hypothetical protein
VPFAKSLLAAAAVLASFGANAVVTGSIGGGAGPYLTLSSTAVDQRCIPNGPAACSLTSGPTTVGTITGGTVYTGDKGFADIPKGTVTGFLAAGPTSGDPAVLTFSAMTSYVSFLWGSPDLYNTLTITDSNGATTNFTASGLGFPVTNGDQSFSTYVQFVASAGTTITSLAFTSGGTDAFETANYTITPIPEPETYALMLAGLAAMGFVSKRRKQQA